MRFFRQLLQTVFVKSRIFKYRVLSDLKPEGHLLRYIAPVLFSGKGKVVLGHSVKLGYAQSPLYYSHYNYIEARVKTAKINIGNNVIINNNCCIVALDRIEIGDHCTIGINFSALDSDFHYLDPNKRHEKNPPAKPIKIGENVFVGNHVTVLKGVVIGNNVVVGSNSLVSKSVPDNVVIGGNPAQIIKTL